MRAWRVHIITLLLHIPYALCAERVVRCLEGSLSEVPPEGWSPKGPFWDLSFGGPLPKGPISEDTS